MIHLKALPTWLVLPDCRYFCFTGATKNWQDDPVKRKAAIFF